LRHNMRLLLVTLLILKLFGHLVNHGLVVGKQTRGRRLHDLLRFLLSRLRQISHIRRHLLNAL
jgi:hypothetical protein